MRGTSGSVLEEPGLARRLLSEVVRPAIYGQRSALEVAAHQLDGEPVPARQAIERPFLPFDVGAAWGPMWGTTWFRFRGTILPAWSGAEVVALVHLGGDQMVGFTAEGLVWDTGGRPVQGLHHRHRELVLTTDAKGGEPVEFFVEAAANPIPPWHLADWPLLLPDPGGAPLYRLQTAELALVDRDVEALFLDMRVLLELAVLLPGRSEEILRALGTAREIVEQGELPGSVTAARAALAPRSTRPRPPSTRWSRWVTPTSTAPGSGRSGRRSASVRAPSPTSSDSSNATPDTGSCAARRFSTSG